MELIPDKSGLVNGAEVKLYYESFGSENAPAIVLVMGLGCQLTMWPSSLIADLCEAGLRVVRFDNRDIGLSTKLSARYPVNIPLAALRYRLRKPPTTAHYTLHEMVADTVSLMDELGIAQAHLAGVSMGGMIAQLLTALHPQRVLSLASIMSSPNEPGLPFPKLRVLHGLLSGGQELTGVAQKERLYRIWRALESPAWVSDEACLRHRIAEDLQRGMHFPGVQRQLHAILSTGSIASWLTSIRVPTAVIHGRADPLILAEGGCLSASLIPGARMHLVPGMGHDLPEPLMPKLGRLILNNSLRAKAC